MVQVARVMGAGWPMWSCIGEAACPVVQLEGPYVTVGTLHREIAVRIDSGPAYYAFPDMIASREKRDAQKLAENWE